MPIQMIGTRRSGSNLLRVMIGQLPEVYAPQSTHMLEYFMPLVPFYGDLSDDDNFTVLLNDLCHCVELNPVEWTGVELDRDEVFENCKSNTILSAFEAIYSIAAKQNNNSTWMCKCLGYINYFDEMQDYFGGNLKYIYIHRDGRDVALSFSKALAGHKHHYFIAKEWANTQRLALKIRSMLPADKFHTVCYESLLQDPETTCKNIAEFIGVPYTSKMLDYHESNLARSSAKSSNLWGNITKPIITNNSKKYLKNTSTEDLMIFELVAGDVLDALGYERHYINQVKGIEFSKNLIDAFELIDNERKESILNTANPDDVKRREIQKVYVDSVKQRLGCTDINYHGNMLHKSSVKTGNQRLELSTH